VQDCLARMNLAQPSSVLEHIEAALLRAALEASS
jgi:hypothetical protein